MRKRLSRIIGLFVVTTLSVNNVFGQVDVGPVPCSNDIDDPGYDPNGCPVPLDTWIILLALAAVSFAAWYLHKNQKRFFLQ